MIGPVPGPLKATFIPHKGGQLGPQLLITYEPFVLSELQCLSQPFDQV
jgi:hypothetical protein